MYDLAPRFPEEDSIKCFEPDLFAADDPYESCACKGPTYPFSSSFNRFNYNTLAESPSPADYYPKYRKHRVTGGKSLQYTTPRICMVPKKGPSPFAYDPFSDYTPEIPRKTFRRKEVSHIYKEKCSGFSSFEERELGITNEEIKPVVDSSASLPDYLKFPGEISKTTLKYKGINWSNSKSERKGLEVNSDVPGPGAYDIEEKKITKKQRPLVEKKEAKVKKCKPPPPENPGFTEFGSEENIKPFRYCGGAQEKPCKDAEKIKKIQSIWGCAERFASKTNEENPPPWAYSPIYGVCHRRIVKLVPFGSCKRRFTYPEQTDLSPASHNLIDGTINDKICRGLPKYKGALTAPFGSTAYRFKPMSTCIEESDSDTQDDHSYLAVVQVSPPQDKSDNQEEEEEAKTDIVYSSECGDYDHEIGPTLNIKAQPPKTESSEDMRVVYKRYNSRRDHRKPLTREGFLSTTQVIRSSWLVANSPSKDVNWPEMVDMKIIGGALKMNMPSQKKEMQPEEDLSVYYDIHPRYVSSVYKPTHNIRLKKKETFCKPIEDENNVKLILKSFIPKEILNA